MLLWCHIAVTLHLSVTEYDISFMKALCHRELEWFMCFKWTCNVPQSLTPEVCILELMVMHPPVSI